MVLALAAGCVNAGAFIACERFVTHVTGTVTRIGLDSGVLGLMGDYMLVLMSFISGAMASVLAIQGRALRGKRPLHALPLLIVATVLLVTALVGHLGAFGPIGGRSEEPIDFALLCVLAFAMGLMNASVASSTALAVRTTHMTGPASDLGVHLATAWLTTGHDRTQALRLAALRGGKVFSFGLGAALMVLAMRMLGYLAFVAPATFVLIATARSFLPANRMSMEKAQSSVVPL
jgi:uncharacterized membrane protein YoaK (UPF0700 family)